MIKKKLLLCIPSLNRGGGAERVFFLLANHLNRELFEISILTINDNKTYSLELKPDIRFICLDKPRVLFSVMDLLKTINNHEPDIILTTSFHLNGILLVFERLGLVASKVIYRQVNTWSKVWEHSTKSVINYVIYMIHKLCINAKTRLVMQSEAMKNDFKESFQLTFDHIVKIYNPIENYSEVELERPKEFDAKR